MDCPINLPKKSRRRRVLLAAGGAVLLLALLAWLLAGTLVLTRLHGRGEAMPNPIQMVREWLFPPPELDLFLDVRRLDEDIVVLHLQEPPPVAPEAVELPDDE